MAGRPFAGAPAARADPARAQAAGQVAGIDADRTGGRAQPATGAGVEAHVGVVVADGAARLAGIGAAGQFTDADDALAGRERQLVRGAQRLAEAAFDAAVDDVVGGGHRFQVLEVGGRIVVEDDARIEQRVGIEKRLDAPHQAGSFLAPFHLDEGCHVAAGAVFGLQRAVVLVHDEVTDIVHEAGIAVDLGLLGEILGEHEVQVALQRMPEDDRLMVAVMA